MPRTITYPNDVFINYHPDDREWVDQILLPRLEEAGLKVLIDHRDFKTGSPVLKNIEHAIGISRHTLAVISQAWLRSEISEYTSMLVRTVDPAGRQRRLLPLMLEPCQLPLWLTAFTYLDLTGNESQDEDELNRLLTSLTTQSRVLLSYLPAARPDEDLAYRLREMLEFEDHQVVTDQELTVGMEYQQGLQHELERCEFVIVLLSAKSIADPKIINLIQHIAALESDRSVLLPVRVDYDEPFPEPVGAYLNQLGFTRWYGPEDDKKVSLRLIDAISQFSKLSMPYSKAEVLTPEDIASRAKLWRNGSLIPIGFMDGEPELQWKVAKAAMEWIVYANLRFVFTDVQYATVRIGFKSGLGSWSYQSTDALAVPKDQATANFGWLRADTKDEEIRRVVLHEFGHVLGLVHEHQAPNADIPWDKEAVYSYYQGPPNAWTRQQIDMNFFQKYRADLFPINKKFDPASIMAFPIPQQLTVGDFEIGWNQELSEYDKQFIGELYPVL